MPFSSTFARKGTSALVLAAIAACSGPAANPASEDPYEKYLGVLQLGDNGGDEAAAQILAIANQPGTPALVREGCLVALLKRPRPEAGPQALRMIRDDDPRVRARACEAVGAVRHEAGLGAVLEHLRVDPDPRVRRSAAKGLAGFPPTRAIAEALVAALKDPDGGVSVLSHERLKRISGADLPRLDSKGWNEWLNKSPLQ
jgi:HEAT repeat protein